MGWISSGGLRQVEARRAVPWGDLRASGVFLGDAVFGARAAICQNRDSCGSGGCGDHACAYNLTAFVEIASCSWSWTFREIRPSSGWPLRASFERRVAPGTWVAVKRC
jgi:hypothetical protein